MLLSIENSEVAGSGFEIQAVGIEHERQQGEAAEAVFLAKASNMGFAVAKPWGNERYDFIVDSGYNFWRVQVKSTRFWRAPNYALTLVASKLVAYKETEIDFLAAYLVPEEVWYIIPVERIKGRKHLYFNPRPPTKSPWEKYREGWCQMACPNEENGPSKVVTPRCRNGEISTLSQKVQKNAPPILMAICPLKQLR